MPPKTTDFKTHNLQAVSEIMALRFLKINEKRHTINKLYISRYFMRYPCKHQTISKIDPTIHPETHQNLAKSTLEKTSVLGIDFGMILASQMPPKMIPNRPQNDPKMLRI